MGISIDREEFQPEEYVRFAARLAQSLEVLRELLQRPGFGAGETTIGAEVEMHLIDAQAQPALVSQAVLRDADDARCTLETDAFNFELNANYVPLAGRPFLAIGDELHELLDRVRGAAGKSGARVALVGTLPTLTLAQLEGAMTDAPRYRAMSRALREMRGEPFSIDIHGREGLIAECDDFSLEGANASLQAHLRVSAADFPASYNAAQLAAAPLVAATANSPFFGGRCLWEETRIALFKQSVDTRADATEKLLVPHRVPFGHGWIHDAFTPFAENASMYAPILPVLSERAPDLAALRAGGVPSLEELRLHHGTVWNWNRAVFDPHGAGHLRIEHRVVPSGPTIADMLANLALTAGLTLALAPFMAEITAALPFAYAKRNLYRAAKFGLNAELAWPAKPAPSPRCRAAREVLLELLPMAEAALVRHGVDAAEAAERMTVIRERVECGRTGAALQRALVAHHERKLTRPEALARMLEDYVACSWSHQPVHRWPIWDELPA